MFTFRQNTKGKGFIFSTFGVALIICLVGIAITFLMATKDSSKEEEIKGVEKLYISNESDMEYVDFSYFGMLPCEQGVTPQNEKKSLDVVLLNDEESEGYTVNIKVPVWSELDEDDAEMIMSYLIDYVTRLGKVNATVRENNAKGLEAQLMAAYLPVSVDYMTEGDEGVNLGTMLFNMLGPMIIVFVLYFMALVYGQTVGKTVISEKVSKLIETLLITVKPTQLIAGKILAMVSVAILQMSMWILGLVSGIGFGHLIAKAYNTDYTNYIIEVIKVLKDTNGEFAFSIPAAIISILVMFIGFLFICVFAGLISSPVSKAEELSSCFSIFQMCIVLAFFAAYFIPMSGDVSPVLDKILHIIPFTAAFMLPGDVLIGRIDIALSLVYVIIMIVFTVIISLYTGKLYKAQVFYNGTETSPVKRLILPFKK